LDVNGTIISNRVSIEHAKPVVTSDFTFRKYITNEEGKNSGDPRVEIESVRRWANSLAAGWANVGKIGSQT
jgi:hypothetical protein